MKQYIIDELRPEDYKKLKVYFDKTLGESAVAGIYWLPLEEGFLTEEQNSHVDCKPHYFAMDIEPNLISCEFLVRTKKRVRCDCISYATEAQRNWLIRYIDSIFENLDIRT